MTNFQLQCKIAVGQEAKCMKLWASCTYIATYVVLLKADIDDSGRLSDHSRADEIRFASFLSV